MASNRTKIMFSKYNCVGNSKEHDLCPSVGGNVFEIDHMLGVGSKSKEDFCYT